MSVDPYQLFATEPMTILEGSVTRAPAVVGDGVYAVADGVEYGPMPWPRDGVNLPVVGQRVLIVQPAYGNPWAIGWDRFS